ncbi:NADH dehydrogenase (ubiquinone) MWFE subunit isoform X2 [Rhynchophorus ferrugineus]
MYLINKLVVGNCYRRRLSTLGQFTQYQRDKRLTNNPYILAGLENIPDEEECEVSVECDEDEENDEE